MSTSYQVPFAIEESGRLGRHALTLLRELAAKGVNDSHLKPPPSWLPSKKSRVITHSLISYWFDLWLQDISASLALHLSSIVVNQVLG